MAKARRVMMLSVLTLAACGGSGGGDDEPVPADTVLRVSAATPFPANCGVSDGGTLFRDAEVEPYLAVNPSNPSNLIGVWQQDRWSSGGSQGVVTAYSLDSGAHWAATALPFSRCGGGSAARATDPWVSFGPDGTAYQIALSFSGATFADGSSGSIEVSRSLDGGAHWSTPQALIQDGSGFFNDKETITADPTDAAKVYAVWDRLAQLGGGPSYFARSTDRGSGWEAARAIYDPGSQRQTIGNQIVVLPNGVLIDLFTELEGSEDEVGGTLALIRSTDKGQTWSAPIEIAEVLAIGARDLETGTLVRDSAGIGSIAVGADGSLVIVWQDARFSGGQRDGIVLVRSLDGGFTWSAPVQINAVTTVQAFTPTVALAADGTLAVSYYDFRNNNADATSLPTDLWLATSTTATHWSEQHVSGPFDLQRAPNARGLFLGDYQGLAVSGRDFLPLFVRTNDSGSNRTDVYFARLEPATAAAAKALTQTLPSAMTPEWKHRVAERLALRLRPEPGQR